MVNLKRQLKIPEAVWNDGTITRHNHIEILQIIDDVLTGIEDGGPKAEVHGVMFWTFLAYASNHAIFWDNCASVAFAGDTS